MSKLVTHGVCGKAWKQRGNRTGHCAKCHETFEGLSLFDWHQTLDNEGGVVCRNPSDPQWSKKELRLIDDTWRGPAWTDATLIFNAN
jgi:hypothetical protein